jgi:hypothetical protein
MTINARDARLYNDAVEIGSKGSKVVWSLVLPVPPGAIFSRHGAPIRETHRQDHTVWQRKIPLKNPLKNSNPS